LRDDQDLEVDIEDPPEEEADKVVNEILEESVAEACAAHFKKLRERAFSRAEAGERD
jgi:hypothetical protein